MRPGKRTASAIHLPPWPLKLMAGRGQVGLRPAIRISLGRAARDRTRLLISLAYGLIFGFALSPLSRSWAYGFSSAFLFSGFICFCSAIPWRVRLIRKPTFAKIFLLNGILAILVGAFCFWTSILLPIGILFGIRVAREVLSHFLMVTSWSLVFPVVGLGIALAEDQEHRERLREAYAKRLEKLAEASRLAALRAQINPHFFFNALNTIAALIPQRPEDAERAVELLAEALRPALTESQPMLSPIETELRIARSYAEIEQLRLGPRVRVEYEVDPGAMQDPLPSLSLQPMLENAFRHGIGNYSGPARIRVTIARNEKNTILEILNEPEASKSTNESRKWSSLPLREEHSLHNIASRLRALLGPDAILELHQGGPGESRIRMTIPRRKEEGEP